MKKTMYYFSPFVIFLIFFLISNLLESVEILDPIMPYFAFVMLFLFAAVIGTLSQSKAKFDYIMTAIIPLAVAFSLFIALFFAEGCDGTPQLSIYHSLNIEYYLSWLPRALEMMAITFIFSFKPVRSFIKNKFHFKNSEK
ncbi:MAG: hypothetical protein E7593_01525 [Ruminococcaceae bacterium]|nr:hypothetical protein [Oscillospiraceae bacterium]